MMKHSPVPPVKLENPLGCGVEGLSRYKPRDKFPYTVIPKAPGFKIGKFKYPDQELLAIKAIANDKERLYRHYFGYFIQKVNNVLKDVGASWHVVGVITPSFDYVILKLKNISEEDAKAFDTNKYAMLTLMDQYRDNVYITNEYMTIERASLDPAVEGIFKCRFKHWLLFIPSALEFVSLDEDTFLSLFDYRDASMEDMDYDTKFSITFTDMEGNPLEHCTPVALTPDGFEVRAGYDCSFSFSVESEMYEVNKAYIENEELVPEKGIYHIHRVTKDIVVKVDVAFGEFAFDFTAINCVLTNCPKRVNRDTEYLIPYAVLGNTYEVRDIDITGAEATYNTSTRVITVSNVTDDVRLIFKAHDMIDVNIISDDNYSYELVDGTTEHTERYHEFKFLVTPAEGYDVKAVFYYRPVGPIPPPPPMPMPCNCGCDVPPLPLTGMPHPKMKRVLLLPINGVYIFTPTIPTKIHVDVEPIEQDGE